MAEKMTEAREVLTLAENPEAGDFRVHRAGHYGPHPADGLTATMAMGDGAFMTFINPQSFADGGPEWVCRYGNVEGIRFALASILESYDYLLSGGITTAEATRRLRLLRAARSALASTGGTDAE